MSLLKMTIFPYYFENIFNLKIHVRKIHIPSNNKQLRIFYRLKNMPDVASAMLDAAALENYGVDKFVELV